MSQTKRPFEVIPKNHVGRETSQPPQREFTPRDRYEYAPNPVIDCEYCDYFCHFESNMATHISRVHPETLLKEVIGG